MLIEMEIKEKNLSKLVKKLNEAYEKKIVDKITDCVKELGKLIGKSGDNNNLIIYLLSIVAEESPEYITTEIIEQIKLIFSLTDLKQKINAIIIFGSALVYHMDSEDEIDIADIDLFIDFLLDPNPEIRQNAAVFIDQFPTAFDMQFMAKLNPLLDLIKDEHNLEILATVGKLVKRIQPKLSLQSLISFVNRLALIYQDSDIPERSDIILGLLETEIPQLKNRQGKTKRDILAVINNRSPLIRFTDIKKMAKDEDLEEDEVLKHLQSEADDPLIYPFEYTEKNKKFFVEFEKKQLTALLMKGKIKVDEIAEYFKIGGLDNKTIINVLIKDMVKNHLIKGYISNEYFYAWDFIRNEILQKLQKEGRIKIQTYVAFLNAEFVEKLIHSLIEQGTSTGFYDQKKEYFYTQNSLLKEIEQQAAKSLRWI